MKVSALTPRKVASVVALAIVGLIGSAQAAFLPLNSTIAGAPVVHAGVLLASQSIPFAAPGFSPGRSEAV